jgi:hypothetical protein
MGRSSSTPKRPATMPIFSVTASRPRHSRTTGP